MSEGKTGDIGEITEAMSKVSISGDLSRENERLKKDQIAVVTIGRLQRPHACHL